MKKQIIDPNNFKSVLVFRNLLRSEFSNVILQDRPIVFVCIGTDRSTGDSLGPIVGSKLSVIAKHPFFTYGSLDLPVHAKNITSIYSKIKKTYINPYIVAIDACLSSIENVGHIITDSNPILPGSAVNKSLPPIGDLSITGVVNISTSFDFLLLQNTRLSQVIRLANSISNILYFSMKTLSLEAINSY